MICTMGTSISRYEVSRRCAIVDEKRYTTPAAPTAPLDAHSAAHLLDLHRPEWIVLEGVLMTMATFASQSGAFVIAEGIEDAELLDFRRATADGCYGSDTVIAAARDMDRPARPSLHLEAMLPHAVGAAVLVA